MEKLTLGNIEIGGGFLFGGVWFRVDKISEHDEELILCQIAAKPGSTQGVIVDEIYQDVPVDYWEAYVYIAKDTIVEIGF